MEAITCPTLAIAFEHDNIVPWRSAKELVDRVSSKEKEWLHLPGAHIGGVVSKSASRRRWPRIEGWFAAQEAKSREATVASTAHTNGAGAAHANGAPSPKPAPESHAGNGPRGGLKRLKKGPRAGA